MLNKTHPFLKSHHFTKENSIKILDKIIIGLIFIIFCLMILFSSFGTH